MKGFKKRMKKNKSAKPSLGDIAKIAKVSRMTVSYALRNQPSVSKATRERILRIAKRLGYAPDARIAAWMLRMRESKSKDLLPIAWLNSKPEKDAWDRFKYLSPYLEGARARALEMGYQIEEIWARQSGMTMQRISRILNQRGIEGVVVSQPARHVRFDWTRMAGVSIDGALLVPNLPRVMSDNAFNLGLALKSLKRLGHRRIGIFLPRMVDSYSDHACRNAAFHYHATTPKPERVPPVFYWWPHLIKDQISTWLRKYKPEVVVGLDNYLVRWIIEAGYRVPEDIGVVHLALDDDVSDWAGIHSNKREIGATAVELVISSLLNRRFGLPKVALTTLVRGSWRSGRTLLKPQAKEIAPAA
jgi:DNA-binding LacI/PurR family transcriptional regulator